MNKTKPKAKRERYVVGRESPRGLVWAPRGYAEVRPTSSLAAAIRCRDQYRTDDNPIEVFRLVRVARGKR